MRSANTRGTINSLRFQLRTGTFVTNPQLCRDWQALGESVAATAASSLLNGPSALRLRAGSELRHLPCRGRSPAPEEPAKLDRLPGSARQPQAASAASGLDGEAQGKVACTPTVPHILR
jgi:hypothetical protein